MLTVTKAVGNMLESTKEELLYHETKRKIGEANRRSLYL